MNDWYSLNKQAKMYKELYPVGTRIELEFMGEDPRPVAPGTRGVVRIVDDMGTVHCDFDNGRRLGLIPGEDSFRKLTAAELAAEQNNKVPLSEVISNAEKKTAQNIKANQNSGKEFLYEQGY